jgi:hypothetical protein
MKFRNLFFKALSILLIVTFCFSQISWAQDITPESPAVQQPVKTLEEVSRQPADPVEVQTPKQSGDTLDFLQGGPALSVVPEQSEESSPEEADQTRETFTNIMKHYPIFNNQSYGVIDLPGSNFSTRSS